MKGGIYMDIGNVSAALSSLSYVDSGSLAEAVGTAMLSKALDSNEAYGSALTKMMEQSVTPELGGNIDLYA